jgi:hypothetical protein
MGTAASVSTPPFSVPASVVDPGMSVAPRL